MEVLGTEPGPPRKWQTFCGKDLGPSATAFGANWITCALNLWRDQSVNGFLA